MARKKTEEQVSTSATQISTGNAAVETKTSDRGNMRKYICENMHFTAAEAYKLLRTNLMFCTNDDSVAKVVVITSSNRGEGKTTTSINLAYTLAETGSKVLLIDGDLRLPAIAKTLNMKDTRLGLSDLLVGRCTKEEAVIPSGILPSLYMILSGTIPPNPSELLSSQQFKQYIKVFEKQYDYVIIDMPPALLVVDALVVSEVVDGYIVVARQNYTSKRELNQCMNQLKFLQSKVFGFVLNDADENNKSYSRYKRYRYRKDYRYSNYYKNYDYYKYSKQYAKDKK